MNFKKFFLAAAPALLLTACASDDPAVNPDNGGGEGTPMYAKIRLQTAAGTRSKTGDYTHPTNSEDGFEVGRDYENNISDVTLVLATLENGKYVPMAVSSKGVAPDPDASLENVYTITFQDTDIVKLHDQTVYIFAYCNSDLTTTSFGSLDLDRMVGKLGEGEKDNAGVWTKNGFLMVNAPNKGIPTKDMPSEVALTNNYNTAEKAFDLGTVDVARVSSRFDFKQVNNNIYSVKDVNSPENEIAQIELLAMAPINIAKEYYYLPRVSGDGTDASWTVCGIENANNYVVSPYFAEKSAANATTISNLFKNYFYNSTGHNYDDEAYYNYTYMTEFSDKSKFEDDDDQNWGNKLDAAEKAGYQTWRYVTENTLPSVASQMKGISTGVIFKAEIKNAAAGSNMAKAMEAKRDIYGYNGTYYGDVESLRYFVYRLSEAATMRVDFVRVFGSEVLEVEMDGDKVKLDENNRPVFKNAISDCTAEQNNGTFKILRNTGGHYYVYYIYRNRHNDNGNPSVMGPMEFGTVRNNVYKLAVTTITDFGHTANPGDDPEPEKPENPDEDPKTYFKVSCRVLPWMVRVNNIEF